MTPKQRVLKRFPRAFCEQNGDMKEIVCVGRYGKAMTLGAGRNAVRAWEDASKRMLSTRAAQEATYALPGSDEACGSCGDSYELRSGSSDTGFCDPCAQNMVRDALRYREFRFLTYIEQDTSFDAYDEKDMDKELDRRIKLREEEARSNFHE